MTLREVIQQKEATYLAPYATLSKDTKGRLKKEKECSIRTPFQRDRDRIIHSKAFRRLAYKTQVFIAPLGDHYRTRLTHTLEVSQIARTISRALFLNEDLTEAIALGHDLGHTPFGHVGEEALNKLYPAGFKHEEQSLRVVDYLEKKGKGLNLTYEVRDGILRHTRHDKKMLSRKDPAPITIEGWVIRFSDRIAYVNHDIDDALRAGLIKDIPDEIKHIFSGSYGDRIGIMVEDVVNSSSGRGIITMSEEIAYAIDILRTFLNEEVYNGSAIRREREKAIRIIEALYLYFKKRPEMLEKFWDMDAESLMTEDLERNIVDFIAGMTDRYALRLYQDLFLPKMWPLG